jgi:hypothetical protein
LDLSKLTPAQFSAKIIDKLKCAGVTLVTEIHSAYSEAARADVDFPITDGDKVSEIIKALRTYNWYKQSPAIEQIFKLDWSKLTSDQIFVIGRNIYQTADGGENRAVEIIKDLRRSLAKLPADAAEHALNGMFYEAYFDHEGNFRGTKLKASFLSELFALETVKKYEKSVSYIRYVLDPYRGSLGVLPNKVPETLTAVVKVLLKDPPVFTSIKCQGKEQLIAVGEDDDDPGWRFSHRGFTLASFPALARQFWNIPENHLDVRYDKDLPPTTRVQLAKGKSLGTLKV